MGIVSHNSLHDLSHCFDGLSAQSHPHLSITLLDNASQDGEADWVANNVPAVDLIINSKNVGFARAHNQIVATLDFPPDSHYMPLNPDVLLSPTYISTLVETLQVTGAGWATGKLLLADSRGQPTGLLYSAGHALKRDGYAFNIGHRLPDDGRFHQPREVFGASGAAPLISAALLAAHQGANGELFDASMFLYGEDVDFDWRARLQGWRCWYAPQAVALHRGSSAIGELAAQAIANRYLSVFKNAYFQDLLVFNLPLIALHILLRLIVTPRTGHQLFKTIFIGLPLAIKKRRRPQITRRQMRTWWHWSARQPSAQPVNLVQRLVAFVRKK